MISRWLRARFGHLLSGFALFVARMKVTPAALSVAGLAMMAVAGLALAEDRSITAAGLMLAGGILDALDGEVARVTRAASVRGAFVDSICDHAGDAAIYAGLLILFLDRRRTPAVMLVFLAMFGSLFGSHARSRAETAGIALKNVGLATRFERLAVLIAGLLANAVTAALCIVAVLSNVSAVQRVVYSLREISSETPVRADKRMLRA